LSNKVSGLYVKKAAKGSSTKLLTSFMVIYCSGNTSFTST